MGLLVRPIACLLFGRLNSGLLGAVGSFEFKSRVARPMVELNASAS